MLCTQIEFYLLLLAVVASVVLIRNHSARNWKLLLLLARYYLLRMGIGTSRGPFFRVPLSTSNSRSLLEILAYPAPLDYKFSDQINPQPFRHKEYEHNNSKSHL